MSQVFISYAKEDSSIAEMLAKALQLAGHSVWWDRHIPPGKTWDEVIGRALDTATCVVVLWSKVSVASRWVREEAEKGASRGRLIPVIVDKVDPPFGFGRIQSADLSGWRGDEHDARFVDVLQAISDLVKMTPERSTADERVRESVKPEPTPPAHEEPQKRELVGRGMGTFVKSVLAVIALIAVGYFGLNHFYVAEPEILGFQAVPGSIEPGQWVSLSWRTRNASQVRVEGIGQVPLTGQHMLSPRETKTYTLTATNRRGRSSSRTIPVVVTVPVPPEPANWISIVHRGAYKAKFYVVWGDGRFESQVQPGGYEKRVTLPADVKTVLLHAQANVQVDIGLAKVWKKWKTIVRMPDAPVQRTYTVTGTYGSLKWSAYPAVK